MKKLAVGNKEGNGPYTLMHSRMKSQTPKKLSVFMSAKGYSGLSDKTVSDG